ncbi:DNA-directed RNA polymerase II subunit [Mucor velutinosus]|uniref:DNA-directed RNA polymerase II subunit n=1 Tax=Mucor velutinosus TaxID=708070 RepID=A0AAN7DLH5_9FUNG|nr:DNA-directed RNA polymerase II subunit [Mucor velutinosus]
MLHDIVDRDDAHSVGIQCQLCCKYKELECSDKYNPDLRFLYRSGTEIIDDFLEPWSNKTVSTLEREEYSSIDPQEDMIDNMIENWWNGSFSIPAPCSYKVAEEIRIGNEEQSTERIVHAEEVDYEDLFKSLMNVNIYAIAEYMSNSEPFCFNEHIINALIIYAAIAVPYLIF